MSVSKHTPAQPREHELEWNDRLQDWLDGAADPAEAAALEAHLESCALCSERASQLGQLDRELRGAVSPLALDESFDAKLFSRIDDQIKAIDESTRAQARQRLEQELQQNLLALARSWRRALLFVIPGIIGGIAIAFLLSGWLHAAGITHMLVAQSAAEMGRDTTGLVQVALTTLVGGGLGALLARWLASVAD